jgi:signal transduction histidine kinase
VQLRELATSARQAYGDVRESIVGLRTLPSAERSLGDVLREYLEIWSQQSGITASFSFDDTLRLRPGVELQLVRIVQEALTNSRKHAKASAVTVDIRQINGYLIATITDNGVGFRADALTRSRFPRFGLTTMRERAESIGGTLAIDAEPGRGTTVRFELPMRELGE